MRKVIFFFGVSRADGPGVSAEVAVARATHRASVPRLPHRSRPPILAAGSFYFL